MTQTQAPKKGDKRKHENDEHVLATVSEPDVPVHGKSASRSNNKSKVVVQEDIDNAKVSAPATQQATSESEEGEGDTAHLSDQKDSSQDASEEDTVQTLSEDVPQKAYTDTTCRAIQRFFSENPEGPVKQSSEVQDETGEVFHVGKALLLLRNKARQVHHTELTQKRLQVLKTIPAFVTFLEQTGVAKHKPTSATQHLLQRWEARLPLMQIQYLELQAVCLQNLASAALANAKVIAEKVKYETLRNSTPHPPKKKRSRVQHTD